MILSLYSNQHQSLVLNIRQPLGRKNRYTGFALTRRSVRPSVSNSCPLYYSFANGRISFKLECTFTSTRGCAESRSQLKVKYLTNKYYTICCVRSITPLLMEGFPSNLNDTFTSTRGCAEPMLSMCQLKVKVTVKGQIFN